MRYKLLTLITITVLVLSSQTNLAVWGDWEEVYYPHSDLTNIWVWTNSFEFKRDFQYKIHFYVTFSETGGDWELTVRWYQGTYPDGVKLSGLVWSGEDRGRDWTYEYNDIGLKSHVKYYLYWKIDVFPTQESAKVACKVEESVSDLNTTTSDDTLATNFGCLSLLALPVYAIIRKKRLMKR